ncbi:NAD(P)-dependent oxidoreductase [Rhodococcus sp. OK302]|uniref:NAD(P)-dependent oxidoreductase n=1 Tax=Rhodococcus sp. OK302 TaxID=1882769 RepID=UPI0034E853B8
MAGFGRIGRSLAERVGALGFPIHIWDPYLTEVPDSVIRWDTVRELAAAVNHLSIHMPSTQQTAGTIDESVLEALGARGHLVNTARGALVDEDALLSSLNSGALGFASLDVLSSEPPTSTAAVIAEHERVLVTPHIAYLSTDSLPQLRLRAAQIARQLLTRESVR